MHICGSVKFLSAIFFIAGHFSGLGEEKTAITRTHSGKKRDESIVRERERERERDMQKAK
jgi:hypothetical protein